MIQFNLLPDIKVKYLKARRQKHLVILGSTVAIIASLSVLLLLISVVEVLQKKNLNDLNADIKTSSQELKDTKDLSKILTVQNQLKSLKGLHDKKAVVSRLSGYVKQLTPVKASIARLNVDYQKNTILISGAADGLATVNQFTDTLKFTTYKTQTDTSAKNAFDKVVLTSFARDTKNATFIINMAFDPRIFSETQEITLTVPNIITTRSQVEQPSALFQKSTNAGGQ